MCAGVIAIDGSGLWSRAGENETAAKVDGGFASRRCSYGVRCTAVGACRGCKRVHEGTVCSVLAVPHLKLRHVLFAPWRSSSCELSCLRRMMAFEYWLVGVHTLIVSVPPDSGLLLDGWPPVYLLRVLFLPRFPLDGALSWQKGLQGWNREYLEGPREGADLFKVNQCQWEIRRRCLR